MVLRLRVALLSALVSLVLVAPAALAYNSEVDKQVHIQGPGELVCPGKVTLTATVVDLNGHPLSGVQVTWSTGDIGTTDSQGHNSISVTITATTVVTATAAGGAKASITITCIQGQVGGTVGLPRTDTALPADSGSRAGSISATPWWLYILGVVVGSGFLILARRRR
jgi:hypothetical protein